MELVRGDEETVVVGVSELQILPLPVADLLARQSYEAADAVLDMHDEVARLQVLEEGGVLAAPLGDRTALLGEAENLGVGEQGEGILVALEAPALGRGAVQHRESGAVWGDATARLCSANSETRRGACWVMRTVRVRDVRGRLRSSMRVRSRPP